ncbi:MAG: response regulator [Phycisphaerales bacterium]|nr:response regulator [Phycisphaerales bacterium]
MSDSPSSSAQDPFVDPHATISAGVDATVMIVDDEPVNIKVIRKYLQAAGYTNFVTETDPRVVIELIRTRRPDVVLMDVMMPEIDGLTLLRSIRADDELRFTPVIIVTASDDAATKLKALELGATDFLAKPLDANDMVPRVRNALMVKAYQVHLETHSARLEQQVRERTAKLEASRLHVMHCLARAGEYRDDLTGYHVIRVGLYAGVLARATGMALDRIALLEQAAQLHDVGKIGIPDAILHKPGRLTSEEFDEMKRHCEIGRDIILAAPTTQGSSQNAEWSSFIEGVTESPALMMAAMIAMTHHEKWDGSGYPIGMTGDEIPIEGRLVAVADVFDALRSERPYKKPFPLEKCFNIITEGRGTHFDPQLVDAFVDRFDEITAIDRELADASSEMDRAA